MLSYFLRQLKTWGRLRETIRHQQETIETLEEALVQPPTDVGHFVMPKQIHYYKYRGKWCASLKRPWFETPIDVLSEMSETLTRLNGEEYHG